MDKLNKRQIILIGVLLVVATYYVIDSGMLTSARPAQSSSEAPKPVNVAEAEKGDVDDVKKYTRVASLLEFKWEDSWEKDPFFYVSADLLEGGKEERLINRVFGPSDAERASEFRLTGISWVGNSGFALINENVVKEGDTIGGFRVEHVAFTHVILRQGSETIRLTISR